MTTIKQYKEEIVNIENIIKRLEEQENQDKIIYTKIPELGIEISQQVYNNKTYAEILEIVKEEQIVTHDMLFKLRSLTDKYPQFKDFWVFCPNPDKVSKNNNYVAGFIAGSGWAWLGCSRFPTGVGSSLGVFLYRKLRSKI
jgi:hypothetical protein